MRLALANSLSIDFFLPPRLNDDNDRGNLDRNAGVNDDCGACTFGDGTAAADDVNVVDAIGLKCNNGESCNESKEVSILWV